MPESPYDELAADYHWLFSREHLAGQSFFARYGKVLERVGPAARILDCACGAGFEAVALARAGYDVTACDASPGMVARTRREAHEAGVTLDVTTCSWEALPSAFPARFDAVFCIGNSLAHAAGGSARAAALAGMYAVLADGGVLVVESRDWEALRQARQRIEMRDRMWDQDGVRGLCLYVWTIPEHWHDPHRAEVVVVVERDGSIRHRLVELTFSPFRKQELADDLARAGFAGGERVEDWPGRYFVVAGKPSAAQHPWRPAP